MELKEIRNKINKIDDEMKKLFEERLVCSSEVAQVKIKNGDCVYKPDREKEIADRFHSPDESWYLAYVKKVIALSRKFQYGKFVEANKEKEDFLNLVKDKRIAPVFQSGGKLDITLHADSSSENALSEKEILAIISDSKLSVESLSVDGKKHTVSVSFNVKNTEEDKKEAYILLYMLYMETI